MKRVALLLTWMLCAAAAQAHSPATSHVTVDNDASRLQVDVAVLDLAQRLPLDTDGDGRVRWAELQAAAPAIDEFLLSSLHLAVDGADCRLSAEPGALAMVRYGQVPHLSQRYRSDCDPAASGAALTFGALHEFDPSHRVYVRSTGGRILGVLTATDSTVATDAAREQGMAALFVEGIHHIFGGYDHLLFLMLLLLPAVGSGAFRQQAWRLAGIVTAFTAAHSVTLALAATGLIWLPAKPVEVAIALSIVAAGVINVLSPRHRIGWKLAAGFGLLHGFGFAGALREIGLAGSNLLGSLLAFNLGVEAGQLMVVAVALPLLALVAQWPRYRAVAVPALSAAGAAAGLYWAVTRL